MANNTGNVLADAERFRKHTENLLAKNRASVDEAQERNKESLTKLNEKLKTFGMNIPELNLQMCGSSVMDWSIVCGGAGCGFCGCLSCDFASARLAKPIRLWKSPSSRLLRSRVTRTRPSSCCVM
ncbi:unnamed protein product [Lasius platythorax]|uniref:Uncharacterized protein n=1 Tax=Lasius platythorax TaxID=488582 RepID=A0AAV2N4K1_9HYME